MMLNIGLGNFVSADKVISIVNPESAPIKRLVQDARAKGMVIDCTLGRRTRAVLVMMSNHIVLSPVQPTTIVNNYNKNKQEDESDVY